MQYPPTHTHAHTYIHTHTHTHTHTPQPHRPTTHTCITTAKDAGIPPGVLNVVTGTGVDAGAPLCQHPKVDKVAFTGSVPTGSRVAATAVSSIKSVSLELGGKSPAIVMSDADLDSTVEWVAFGCFWTNGQICSATSRVLVHEDVADEFLRRLVDLTKSQICAYMGHPLEPDTKLGPVVSEDQMNRVLSYIDTTMSEERGTL